MAINSITNYFSSVDRTSTVGRLRVVSPLSMPVTAVPSGLSSDAQNPASVSLTEAQSLVSKARDALQQVQTQLETLRQLSDSAISINSLESFSGISRLSLQADARRAIDGIDNAVAAATVGNSNLVSSASRDVRLPTTGLGGSIVAAVQALDSKALGLSSLDLSTDQGVSDAITAVSNALADIATKEVRITGLASAFQNQSVFASSLQGLIASNYLGYGGYNNDGRSQTATRGALVNITT